MKIFFDGGIFSRQKRGGISRLGFELMRQFGSNSSVEQIFYRGFYIDEYLFQRKWFSSYYGIKRPGFLHGRIFNLLDNLAVNYFYNHSANKDLIYYSLYYRVPKKPKGPVAVVCHDMIHELFSKDSKSIGFKKKAFDAADMILSVSESTKKDLCRVYPDINPEKVKVIHLGVGEIFFQETGAPQKNGRPYLLYVGARSYDYKNFTFLLDAFVAKKYFLDFDLVVFGGEKEFPGEQPTWLRREIGVDAALARMYAGAAALVYPSLYEGFGIPPLEAMAAGCPVIASNASSIPEVVGDAGLLFDPKDQADFTAKLEKILYDKTLAAQLAEKGRQRARQFTWQAMANRVYVECQALLKKEVL